MTTTSDSPASVHFETGSLTQRAPQQSEFIGSSSGVHFIKLVRAAFADASLTTTGPSRQPELRAEDIVGGSEDEDNADNVFPSQTSAQFHLQSAYSSTAWESNSPLPSHAQAQTLAVDYFQTWHPLLPFLHGPTFMRDLDHLYLDGPRQQGPSLVQPRRTCQTFLLRCLFATVSPAQASVSPADTLAVVGQLASHNDLLTIQAIIMAQLRCITTMALRVASSHSGLLSRLLLHAGLHRCPYRYEQLDNALRDLRKRIFWSAYILDKYLSQALGLPPAIADSDVDVCAPGCTEKHASETPVSPGFLVGTTQLQHVARSSRHAEHQRVSPSQMSPQRGIDGESYVRENLPSPEKREFLLAHMVTHAQLVSQVLEVFHKSIHVRSVDPDRVLSIRADANKWFNSLPNWPPRPGKPAVDQLDRPIDPEQVKFISFLHILYQQLLIAIHRPYLSLPRSSAEYSNSIQLVIRAARQTITLLLEIDDLFWPGYLASAWMSGLVLIFACQTMAFSASQGIREINKCLATLARMQSKWKGATRCHAALSALVNDFSTRQSGSDVSSPRSLSRKARSTNDDGLAEPAVKRFRSDPSRELEITEALVGLPPNSASQAWPMDDRSTQNDIHFDTGLGIGDMFPNMSWDGDFSTIDHFTTNGFSQEWLG